MKRENNKKGKKVELEISGGMFILQEGWKSIKSHEKEAVRPIDLSAVRQQPRAHLKSAQYRLQVYFPQ